MKLRNTILLLPFLAMGCVDESPTNPGLEQRVFNLLGGLELGEALTLSGGNAENVFLAGGAEGRDYLYVPFFATQQEGTAKLTVELTGENVQATGATGSSSLQPAPQIGSSSEPVPLLDFSVHDRIRRSERALERTIPLAQARFAKEALRATAQAVPQVGDRLRLNANPNSACASPNLRTARVAAVTERAIVAVDTANPASSLTNADYREIGLAFDTLIYPTETAAFGEPTDIDQNQRVIIFYTRVVNELTPPNSRGLVGGFFFGRDLFPKVAQGGLPACPGSNFAEVFYLLAADPAGVVNNNPRSEALVKRTTVGVVGHEFEHLINASRRLYVNNAERFEEPWLDEGLAHIAEELLFYRSSGLQPRKNINVETIRSSQRTVDAFNMFMGGNIGRYWTYLENPSAESLLGVDTELETRGAIWSFLRYAADHKRDDAVFRALVNAKTAGLANLAQALSQPPLDRMQQWTVSVYTDDFVSNVDTLYTQPSWNMRSIIGFLNNGRYPLKVLSTGANNRVSVELKGGGSAFITFRAVSSKQATIRTTGNAATPPEALRISVVRIR